MFSECGKTIWRFAVFVVKFCENSLKFPKPKKLLVFNATIHYSILFFNSLLHADAGGAELELLLAVALREGRGRIVLHHDHGAAARERLGWKMRLASDRIIRILFRSKFCQNSVRSQENLSEFIRNSEI